MEDLTQALHQLEIRFPSHRFEWKGSLGICPFHKDTNQSLTIYKGKKDGAIRYFCFGCQEGGNIFEGKKPPLNSLLQSLIKKPEEKKMKTTIHDISWTIPWRMSDPVVRYLKQRGVSERTANYWQIRSARTPEGHAVMIPDVIVDNKTRMYQLRYIENNSGLRYMSTEGSKHLMRLKKFSSKTLVLVEGPFDALAVGKEAVPLIGKYLTSIQFAELEQLYKTDRYPKKIVICLDGGKEELELAYRIAKRIKSIKGLLTKSAITICKLPKGNDPGNLGKEIFNYERKIYP